MKDSPLHIVLADDDADDRLFFKEAIDELKVQTIITMLKDGVELMKYLKTPNIQLPNVVFLDLNMPLKGGLQCLCEIRSDSALKDLSVAIFSTSNSEEDIEETFVKGANIYIRKPSNFNELKRVLTEVITINWQYHTSGFNRENFLFKI